MDVIVSVEQRFQRTPDGVVWTDVAFGYEFWQRYLEVFDQVRVLARVADVASVNEGAIPAGGERVAFLEVPYYRGALKYAARAFSVRRYISTLQFEDAAVIMRVPSFIASHVGRRLHASGRPYGVEIVGDPYDVFAPGATNHPLRGYFRWSLTRDQQRQCMRACAAAYVTQYTLQRRYPCQAYSIGVSDVHLPEAVIVKGALATYFSSVELPQDAFASGHRRTRQGASVRLLTVGSLEQPYKGVQYLLQALRQCQQNGLDATLVVVGDGKFRKKLEQIGSDLCLRDSVSFLGKLPRSRVIEEMDKADIFVSASLSEGLPRVLIEAMARALPCIGTRVGGIPELLQESCMVAPGNAEALAEKIIEIGRSGNRMAEISKCNFAKSQEYSEQVLRRRRFKFYSHVRERTEDWLKEHV